MDQEANLAELLDYIEKNAACIFVRDQVNGEWGNYLLSELPAPRALYHAFRWIREKHVRLQETGNAPAERDA